MAEIRRVAGPRVVGKVDGLVEVDGGALEGAGLEAQVLAGHRADVVAVAGLAVLHHAVSTAAHAGREVEQTARLADQLAALKAEMSAR